MVRVQACGRMLVCVCVSGDMLCLVDRRKAFCCPGEAVVRSHGRGGEESFSSLSLPLALALALALSTFAMREHFRKTSRASSRHAFLC